MFSDERGAQRGLWNFFLYSGELDVQSAEAGLVGRRTGRGGEVSGLLSSPCGHGSGG